MLKNFTFVLSPIFLSKLGNERGECGRRYLDLRFQRKEYHERKNNFNIPPIE